MNHVTDLGASIVSRRTEILSALERKGMVLTPAQQARLTAFLKRDLMDDLLLWGLSVPLAPSKPPPVLQWRRTLLGDRIYTCGACAHEWPVRQADRVYVVSPRPMTAKRRRWPRAACPNCGAR